MIKTLRLVVNKIKKFEEVNENEFCSLNLDYCTDSHSINVTVFAEIPATKTSRKDFILMGMFRIHKFENGELDGVDITMDALNEIIETKGAWGEEDLKRIEEYEAKRGTENE